jgi:hypothetical protein
MELGSITCSPMELIKLILQILFEQRKFSFASTPLFYILPFMFSYAFNQIFDHQRLISRRRILMMRTMKKILKMMTSKMTLKKFLKSTLIELYKSHYVQKEEKEGS